ncbi:MAG: hypothetical protein ACKV2V_23950 [Blastocatellia bacterium]
MLRFLVYVLAGLLIGALVLAGLAFGLYRRNINIADESVARAATLQKQLDDTTRALQDKTAQLEKITNSAAKQKERLGALIPRVMISTFSPAEVGEFASLLYDSPGRRVEVGRIPPNDLFTRYFRFRVGDRVHKYVLSPGEIEGKWYIHSSLVNDNAGQK